MSENNSPVIEREEENILSGFFSHEIPEMFVEFRDSLSIYHSALKTMCTKLEILNEEFNMIHRRNPIAHITSRVKSPRNIAEKLKRKELEVSVPSMKENLFDIAGVRIICSFIEDIYLITDVLKAQDDVIVLKEVDYIKKPKPNGYRSLHLTVAIPVFLSTRKEMVNIEIQIRTIGMDFWASLEHDLHYKRGKNTPLSMKEDLKECAENIALIDMRMQLIKKQADALDEIK